MLSYHPHSSEDSYTMSAYHDGFVGVDNITNTRRLAKCMRKFTWSPIIWRNGKRAERNFLGAVWCVLDFDDGAISLSNAIENIWADSIHVIGTTRSNQIFKNGVKCDRFRVALLWNDVIRDLGLYKFNMAHRITEYSADLQCKDGARAFFPCKEIVSVNTDGYTLGVIQPDPQDKLPREMAWDGRPTQLSRYAMGILTARAVEKGERDITAFRLAKDLFKAGLSESDVLATLEKVRFDPPLPKQVIEKKVRSAVNQLQHLKKG